MKYRGPKVICMINTQSRPIGYAGGHKSQSTKLFIFVVLYSEKLLYIDRNKNMSGLCIH
jgi:hypothetical protein